MDNTPNPNSNRIATKRNFLTFTEFVSGKDAVNVPEDESTIDIHHDEKIIRKEVPEEEKDNILNNFKLTDEE